MPASRVHRGRREPQRFSEGRQGLRSRIHRRAIPRNWLAARGVVLRGRAAARRPMAPSAHSRPPWIRRDHWPGARPSSRIGVRARGRARAARGSTPSSRLGVRPRPFRRTQVRATVRSAPCRRRRRPSRQHSSTSASSSRARADLDGSPDAPCFASSDAISGCGRAPDGPGGASRQRLVVDRRLARRRATLACSAARRARGAHGSGRGRPVSRPREWRGR